jgi:DNA-binding CsgD family transcriptional regulator
MNGFLQKVSRVGCHPGLTREETHRVIVSNQVALLFLLPPIPYFLLLLYLKLYMLGLCLIPLVMLYSGVTLWLNYSGRYTLAKFAIVGIPAVVAFFYGLMVGPNTSIFSLFLGLAGVASLIFHPKEWGKIALSLAFAFLGFVGLQVGTAFIPPLVSLTPVVRALFIAASSVISFSIVICCIRFYLHLSVHYSDLLQNRMTGVHDITAHCQSITEWQEICENIFKYQLNIDFVEVWFSDPKSNLVVLDTLPPYLLVQETSGRALLDKTGCDGWLDQGVSVVLPFMSGNSLFALVGLNSSYVLSKEDLAFVGFVARELQKNLQLIHATETMRTLNLSEFVQKNEAMLLEKNLTEREMEIVALIVQGFSNAQISEKLIVTESTTKRHIYNLFKKLEINSRFELLKWVNDKALAG